MNINLHILNASGRLNTYLDLSKKTFNETLKKTGRKIPLKDIDVVIIDNPEATIEEIGIGGVTLNLNCVIISVDSEHKNLAKNYSKALLDSLAHELHHIARWKTVGYGKTLLEAMISEGLADHFANEIIGKKEPHLWDKALSKEQISIFLKRASKEFANKKYDYYAWFFGSKKKQIPKWTAYSLGYCLVEEYIKKHPGATASTLYKAKAEKFIK